MKTFTHINVARAGGRKRMQGKGRSHMTYKMTMV